MNFPLALSQLPQFIQRRPFHPGGLLSGLLLQLLMPILLAILVLFSMLGSGTAIAQTAETPPDKTPYASLADILEDDAARAKLVAELRQLAEADTGTETSAKPEVETPSEHVTFARRLTNETLTFTQNMVTEVTAGLNALSTLWHTDTQFSGTQFSRVALQLGMVIIATLALFLLLRRLARPLFSRIDRWSLREHAGRSLMRRALAVVGAILLDLLVVILAWIGGYAVALLVVGDAGDMSAQQSLFLNAFLMVEVFKVAIRALFASKDDGLRLLPMQGEDAAYWSAWLSRLSSIIGYGLLFIAPLVTYTLSPALGRMTTLLIMGIAFLYALVIILQNRLSVTRRLQARAQTSDSSFVRVTLGMLARCWYVIAIGYFAVLAVVTLLHPEEALPLMLKATLQTLLAIGGGAFLSAVLTQIISRQVQIPAETKLRFPLLEQRLNGFIPTALKAMRFAILVVVIALVLDAWGVFNLGAWLASDAGIHAVGTIVTVALILLAAMATWIATASWIEHRLNAEMGGSHVASAREKTLLSIFRNALAIALIIMTLMIVLSEIGINIGPLIAGAGVLGLAIGFGAQKLVQDIITGIFIQMDNAINVGDVVSAGGVTGTAEKLTIRSLGIRDLSGTYHLIPFSSVDTVSNFMRGFAFHVGEYRVAYRENTDEVIARLRDAFNELMADPEQRAKILDDLEVHGVTALADSAVNVRVRIKTLPGAQWGVGREYNRLVKRHLDAAGIEIPFPHLTLYFGQDKDGKAPPAPIQVLQSSSAMPQQLLPADQANLAPPGAPEKSDVNPQGQRDS